jgi:hypothetical protein
MWLPPPHEVGITGRCRFRRAGLFGRSTVLQVEVTMRPNWMTGNTDTWLDWRDVQESDLFERSLRLVKLTDA